MPEYYGSIKLAQQIQNETSALLKAGAQLLAEHDLAVKLDPTDEDHHSHLIITQDGSITADPSEHVCEHHSHKGVNGTAEVKKEETLAQAPKRSTKSEPSNKSTGKSIDTDRAIALLNAAHGFVRPNILDAKLGVVLYDKDAREEKKIRFDKVSAETTHKNFGFRIAGMRVWQGEGATGENINSEGYRVYDKNYGRLEVNNDNIVDAFRNFLFSESAGVDVELGNIVTKRFLDEVQNIEQVIFDEDSEMFSASLLFVYEGDGEALREALELEKAILKENAQQSGKKASSEPVATTPKADVEADDADDLSSLGEDEDEMPCITVVNIIDFAHATWKAKGSGHDANSLKGVSGVADILAKIVGADRLPLQPRGRAKEIKA